MGEAAGRPTKIDPATLRRIGTVDERFQSYNVEMAEVTGGSFWIPYAKQTRTTADDRRAAAGHSPVGLDPELFAVRPPIDLSTPRLGMLAAALGPAYVRVSGTWANTTYFHDAPTPAPAAPPAGFQAVLTREQWSGVVGFAEAVDAKLVTSFATGAGTRDRNGVWTPGQARSLLAYTESVGGSIAAAEFMNEPTYAAMGGAPKGYDAAAFGRDIAVFHPFLQEAAPGALCLGPGSIGEQEFMALPGGMTLRSEDLLACSGRVFDAFSYHFYGAASRRCAAMLGGGSTTTAEAALSEEWLARTEVTHGFYASLRDRFEPGAPLWVTETADAACGGNPWASTFLDCFRYLEQLARLARRGVQAVIHNTLASSDYGLLDEATLAPRPNYWAALLWRRVMGTDVLDAAALSTPSLHVYAHSLRGRPQGVALLVINTDRTAARAIDLAAESNRYTLTAKHSQAAAVELNGGELQLGADGGLPELAGEPTQPGALVLPPASITFLSVPNPAPPDSRMQPR